MYLPAGYKILNPNANPLISYGAELADVSEVEDYAIYLANEVYKSIFWNEQPTTVKYFVKKKFIERFRDLVEKGKEEAVVTQQAE